MTFQAVSERKTLAKKSAAKFRVQKGHTYAVLNGDVIASTDLEPKWRRKLPDLLKRAARELPAKVHDAIPYPIAVYSGDSWQLMLAEPRWSLRAALGMRAFLRNQSPSLDSRVVVGIGGVDFVPNGNIAQAEGEAFRISGRLLSELDARCGMRLRIGDVAAPAEAAWDAVVRVLDALILSAWTPARSRCVQGALASKTQADIAEMWAEPIRQSTVSRYLSEARWHTVDDVLDAFENAWDPRE